MAFLINRTFSLYYHAKGAERGEQWRIYKSGDDLWNGERWGGIVNLAADSEGYSENNQQIYHDGYSKI